MFGYILTFIFSGSVGALLVSTLFLHFPAGIRQISLILAGIGAVAVFHRGQ
jgi:hypothetical protein